VINAEAETQDALGTDVGIDALSATDAVRAYEELTAQLAVTGYVWPGTMEFLLITNKAQS
jgi:hypothetical protein